MDLLTVSKDCHNCDPWSDSALTPFLIQVDGNDVQIGFLLPAVVKQICNDITSAGCTLLQARPDARNVSSVTEVRIVPSVKSSTQISASMKTIVERWRDENIFPDPLNGWRNELYSIYAPTGKEAFRLERAACALFGVATYGVHATAYTPDFRVWVPRRAKDKSTWPGYLDNSVAGGISAGDQMYESMVRECWEEAGLQEDVVRKHMRQTGVISYIYKTRAAGWIQPEVEFTYDIALPDDRIQLRPEDGEAEDFQLMDKEEVMERMRNGEFKPNCALVLIDFYIRHGFITAENCDCDYVALTCALHNDLRLPGP